MSEFDGLTLALSKGRILKETLPFLVRGGIRPLEDPETSRKLIIPTTLASLRLLMVRASDTPTYVRYGAADFGIAGKDVLLESDAAGLGLYQPIDLDIARCRMVVAAPLGFPYAQKAQQGARLRIATKYVHSARSHFAAKGMHVDLIKLYGSIELAPLVGLADAIVDLVSSGATLKANNLQIVEDIMPINARLIINRTSMKLAREALTAWIQRFSN